MAAARRDIWKASQMQRLLAEHGLVISAGKMSGLWSGAPSSIKLSDLDVICAVLNCGVEELLIAEPHAVPQPPGQPASRAVASSPAPSGASPVTPRRRDGRSLPPP
jgi:DNA-binding Xre family transcriptional regulator